MATTAIPIVPSNTVLPGSHPLRTAQFPATPSDGSRPLLKSLPSVKDIVSGWISSANGLLSATQTPSSALFVKEAYWRDLLCMTWDFRTIQGPQRIADFIAASSPDHRICHVSLDESADYKVPKATQLGDIQVIQAFLHVETYTGRGRGLVRLVPDIGDGSSWKAYTLFTSLEELKGHEEKIHTRRPTGHEAEEANTDWKTQLNKQHNYEGAQQPTVLIIGAGQSGLTVAARLKQLNVDTVIIDQNSCIGDNWRNRYRQLVLHDSVWYDHMPYLHFPPNWPVFTPKDKLADWFSYYTGALELNVWMRTTLTSSRWDEDARQWTVTLTSLKNDVREDRIVHPRHIILATGLAGEPHVPADITGIGSFEGDRLVHSSRFTEPSKNAKGKRAVIVGSCNSGHDIARDYYDHGYSVTMVQRSSTLVLTSETLIDGTMKGLYAEDGPPVDDADIINMSLPNPVAKALQIDATTNMMRRDSGLLCGLDAAGFKVDSGPDGAGLFMKFLCRGGGYYIDTGASQLIIDGKIKIIQGQGVKAIQAHGLLLEDGTAIEADEIVLATGYQSMRETARKIFGEEVAESVNDVWGFDTEGETRTIWRRSGHPGLWFFGGNLALCRFYSRLLALQIKGIEVGLLKL